MKSFPVSSGTIPLFFTVVFLLFSLVSSAQEMKVSESDSHENVEYVRSDSAKKESRSKGEKKKRAVLNKKLEKTNHQKKQGLASLEDKMESKTNQQADTLTKKDKTHKAARLLKRQTKQSGKLSGKEKQAEQKAINKVRETKEVKEGEEKARELTGSSNSLSAQTNQISSNYKKLKETPPDTLKKELGDSIKNRVGHEIKDKAMSEAKDVKELGQGMEVLDQVKTFKKDSANADQIAEDIIKKTAAGKELEKIGGKEGLGEMNKIEEMTKEAKELQEQAKLLQDQEQMKKYAKEKATKLANVDMAQYAPQIQQAQQSFTKYKKKMEWIKEGSGPNANSLKDEPLKKRLIYGGNFQIPTLQPFSFLAAPFIGYKLNKKFSSGVSFTYKVTPGNNFNKTNSTGSEYGYRVFTDYKLIKGWFGHGEFERLSQTAKVSGKDTYKTQWVNNGYIGAGRQINAFKGFKINAMFLVNILHKDLKYLNPNAFQFRFGVSK